jgi:hypothetical protein
MLCSNRPLLLLHGQPARRTHMSGQRRAPMAAVNCKVVALRLARNRLRDCRADSYQLARSDSLGSTPSFQVLAGLL